jgi:hypothetical protein
MSKQFIRRWALPAAFALAVLPAVCMAQDATTAPVAEAAAAVAEAPPTAADAIAKVADLQQVANTIWTLIAACWCSG